MRINVNEFSSKVFADIKGIVKAEQDNAKNIIENLAGDVQKRVQQKSPKSPKKYKKYAKGWKVKKEHEYGNTYFVVTNTTKPQLTHILENGTVQRKTKSGANRGAVKKQPHIRPAFDEVVAEYENKYLK